MQLLTWLAAEIVSRLAAFSPGRGVAGTAYVHVLQKEPTQQLMPLVEEKILQLNFTSRVPLTPRAIANLVSLLYRSPRPTTHPSPALTHLCSLAACHLNSFEAAELVDFAAGLANCKKLDVNSLNRIRRALDASLTSKDERRNDQGRPFERSFKKNSPEILAEFFETLVIAKPAGWSCATGVSGNAKINGIPLLSHILAASYEHVHILQDPSADNGLAHRLDVETSGALLVGTTLRSYWRLRLEFSAQKVKRQYLAVVHGLVLPQVQELDLPLRLIRVAKTSDGNQNNDKTRDSSDTSDASSSTQSSSTLSGSCSGSVQSKSIVSDFGRPEKDTDTHAHAQKYVRNMTHLSHPIRQACDLPFCIKVLEILEHFKPRMLEVSIWALYVCQACKNFCKIDRTLEIKGNWRLGIWTRERQVLSRPLKFCFVLRHGFQISASILPLPGDMTLLLAEPQTGRTHQIRSHLARLGYPIATCLIHAQYSISYPLFIFITSLQYFLFTWICSNTPWNLRKCFWCPSSVSLSEGWRWSVWGIKLPGTTSSGQTFSALCCTVFLWAFACKRLAWTLSKTLVPISQFLVLTNWVSFDLYWLFDL